MAVWRVLIAGVLYAAVVFAQTAERCVLAGTVFNSATNAGIAHALVSYLGVASGYRFTDAGGNFQIPNVPCLQYSLAVSKAGFVSGQEQPVQVMLAGREPLDPESTEGAVTAPRPANIVVDLKSGSPPARIPLMPVSSISGIVLDENGEPLEGVSLQSIAVKPSLAGVDYVPAKSARTDDRGRYTLLGLPPGDYVVRLAGEVSATSYFMGSTLNLHNDHRGLPPVYYPNTDSLASATVLHLAPAERSTADFRQATEAAFDINGHLTGFVPQAWTQMQLYRDGDRLPVGRAWVNIASGQFRVIDVPRGSYTLRAVQYQADPAQWLAAEEPVVITSEPIRNLAVGLSGGVDIPVSVSYEAGAKEGGMVLLTLRPQHTRANTRQLTLGEGMGEGARLARLGSASPPQEAVKPDTQPSQPSVLTNVVPDKYLLKVQVLGHGSYVAFAKLGDVDVLHGEFSVSGSAPGELHITIRGDSALVEGQVTLAGQPAQMAQVYLIPISDGTAGMKFGFGDEGGHYQIAGVPPGDYRLQAWMGVPTAKDILSSSGETLTLQPGEQRTVAIAAKQSSNPSEQR
jgi:Carboxypeptidase regulatory-like domain